MGCAASMDEPLPVDPNLPPPTELPPLPAQLPWEYPNFKAVEVDVTVVKACGLRPGDMTRAHVAIYSSYYDMINRRSTARSEGERPEVVDAEGNPTWNTQARVSTEESPGELSKLFKIDPVYGPGHDRYGNDFQGTFVIVVMKTIVEDGRFRLSATPLGFAFMKYERFISKLPWEGWVQLQNGFQTQPRKRPWHPSMACTNAQGMLYVRLCGWPRFDGVQVTQVQVNVQQNITSTLIAPTSPPPGVSATYPSLTTEKTPELLPAV